MKERNVRNVFTTNTRIANILIEKEGARISYQGEVSVMGNDTYIYLENRAIAAEKERDEQKALVDMAEKQRDEAIAHFAGRLSKQKARADKFEEDNVFVRRLLKNTKEVLDDSMDRTKEEKKRADELHKENEKHIETMDENHDLYVSLC